MTATFHTYEPAVHFTAVRDFLAETFDAFGARHNWDICRWQYARNMVAHLRNGADGIRAWEGLVGLWQDGGRIEGVVHTEEPWRGEAWFETRPASAQMLPAMLDWAEAHLAEPDTGALLVHVPECDADLARLCAERGYERSSERDEHVSEIIAADVPETPLPEGFRIRSMADGTSVEAKRKGLSLGFDHPDPADWTSAETYAEVQAAPDYRPDLDVHVVAPGGEVVSTCCTWWDPANRLGIVEPVSTHPDYRRMGLGRACVLEGVRRAGALGAARVQVGTRMHFYLAIGFRPVAAIHAWMREN